MKFSGRLTALIFILVAEAATAQTPAAPQAPVPPAPPATPPAPPPPACTAPEHRQFDFWVGSWDVFPTGRTDRLVGHSLIERLYDGCVIRENWIPHRLHGGGSISSYFPDEGVWRQVWADSSNGWGVFEGRFENGGMTLSGVWKNVNGPGTQAVTRTTWSRQPDGSVRQFGEARGEDGSWSPAFDFTYRPSVGPIPSAPAPAPGAAS